MGKYHKIVLQDPDALATVAALALPVESSAGPGGVAALPPATVQQLLVDRRRLDLLQPFKLALLKLASQVRLPLSQRQPLAGGACCHHARCLPPACAVAAHDVLGAGERWAVWV